VTGVHIAVGSALLAVNLAAALLCAYLVTNPLRGLSPRAGAWFWRLVRTGQGLVVLEAAIGGVLVVAGKELPSLHLVYGLTPLGVSFVAEQLRIASAQSVLDQRELEDAQAVGALPAAEQQEIVRMIVRREQSVMGAAAFVIVLLGARASGLF
jgi:hypothetical protein